MSKTKKRILLIISSIIILLTIVCSIFRVFIISGNSMEPALYDGELYIASKIYKLDRFDVVVVNFNSKQYVKRVIGLPNEKIEYIDNKLYVNGEVVEDTYGMGNTNDFSITLKEDEIYCLGDNREYSKDSRQFGVFKLGYIIAEIRK